MAELQLKEVQDFLSEELQVLKKDFTNVREKDQATFDNKVKEAMDKLGEDLRAKHEDIQKEMDKSLADLNEKLQASKETKKKSFGWSLHETLKDNIEDIAKKAKAGTLSGMTIGMKDFNYSDFTGYEAFATDYLPPILNKYEQFHYRNIMPAGTTQNEFLKYPKETTTTGGADVWAYGTGDGGANVSKPELDPTLITYQSDVEWLAAIVKGIPISMLDDLSWMSSFLQTKGRNELLKREDLYIQGILTDAANSEAYNGSKTTIFDIIIDAAFRQLKDNLHMPNGVVLSNADYTAMLIAKATGSGEYDAPSVVTVNPSTGLLQIVGMPVFAHTYFAQGEGLIGDWNEVQLVTRQAPRLRFFDQNSDDAEKNVIMMRIEERITVPVFYDNAMITLSLPS